MLNAPTRALRRVVTAGVAVLVSTALAVTTAFLLVQPASAAAASKVSVGGVATGNGTLVTPKVAKSGKAKVTGVSIKIMSGRRVVASTSTPNKTVKLAAGRYTVKTTVAYKVGKKKKSYSKATAVTVKVWNPASMSKAEFNRIKPGQTKAQVKAIVGSLGKRTDYSEYEWDGEVTVNESYEWAVTGSEYGFAMVFFTNGVVDEGFSKYFSD